MPQKTNDKSAFNKASYHTFRIGLILRAEKAYGLLDMNAILAAKDAKSPLHNLYTLTQENEMYYFRPRNIPYEAPEEPNTTADFLTNDEALSAISSYFGQIAKELLQRTFDGMSPHAEMWTDSKDAENFLRLLSYNPIKSTYEDGTFISGLAEHYVNDTVHSFLTSLRQFGRNSEIDRTIAAISDPSADFKKIKKSLGEFKDDIGEKLVSVKMNPIHGLEFPAFDKKKAQSLNQLCTDYLNKNGYQDDPENTAVRRIKQASDRAIMNRYFLNRELPNNFLHEKLNHLSTALESVGTRKARKNSAEFEYLRESLQALCKEDPDHMDADKIKALRDAAANYMDEKVHDPVFGGSRRRTPKGRLRFDIASEIYDLCSNYNWAETTEKDLRTVKQQLKNKVRMDYDELSGSHTDNKKVDHPADLKKAELKKEPMMKQ